MSETRIKKRKRSTSPSPERVQRKRPYIKTNDKRVSPINTSAAEIKSSLRMRDLADRWIAQTGSIGRVIDGNYCAVAPHWKKQITCDFLLPLLHSILKHLPHGIYFEAVMECAYWLLHEYCRSESFHVNHDALALVMALVLLSSKSENHPLRMDHMTLSVHESRVLGCLFGIPEERHNAYMPKKEDVYGFERVALELVAFNLHECPHPLQLCRTLEECARKNEKSPWKWFRQQSFASALKQRLRRERGLLGVSSAGRALSGELAVVLSCVLIEVASVSGGDPRAVADLEALEASAGEVDRGDVLPSAPWREAGQEVLSLLSSPLGPALLLSHQDLRGEVAVVRAAAKLARTVLERAVGTATVEAWVEHMHHHQQQQQDNAAMERDRPPPPRVPPPPPPPPPPPGGAQQPGTKDGPGGGKFTPAGITRPYNHHLKASAIFHKASQGLDDDEDGECSD